MKLTATALAAAAMFAASPAMAAEPITGKWVTEEGDAVVTIGKCGSTYCGRISKFLETPPDGADQRDVNNPDAKKRSRKLMGMPVLFNFSEAGDEWKGQIYDPEAGKYYRSVVERASASRLTVKGCIGPFCKSQTWKRAN